MLKIKRDNILNAKEDILVHQVNVDGIMGGGVARQLAEQYPGLEKEYSEFCKMYENNYSRLKGMIFCYKTKKKLIFNFFSQTPNFCTDYEMFRNCMKELKYIAEKYNLSIAMPYGIGCGIANGNWNIIYKIIQNSSEGIKITLYKLEESKCKKEEVLKNKLKKLLNILKK